jgi:hypothetical protein
VESGKSLETFVWTVVVDEPTIANKISSYLQPQKSIESSTHRGLSGNMKIRAAEMKLSVTGRYYFLRSNLPRNTAGIIWIPRGTRHWAVVFNPMKVPYETQPATKAPIPSMNCWRAVMRPLIDGWAISDW